jgi:CDP-6-deoxy-D-xylo-4-hexulose-3-dehydrase
MIRLVEDTINKNDIQSLIRWLETNPRLTKGEQTILFEKEWSAFTGVKHSVFVNSGSSANLGIISALVQSGKLKNNKVLVPAVSWSTTVAPVIQCGLIPILVDADENNLGMCVDDLKLKIKEHNPSTCIIVHVLGFPCHMNEIMQLCQENDITLIEDSCESVGSVYAGRKTGCFGLASSFSFYFGHHMSTIEGGMICTNDDDFYELIKSVRSHGWDRDISTKEQTRLRKEYNVDEFSALYTFYYDGFNLRSTDLQAFIGREQLYKLPEIISKRQTNFNLYQSLVKEREWKPNPTGEVISNFAYPIISKSKKMLVETFNKEGVECRPLICGSIGQQPFWKKRYGECSLPMADRINKYGMYVPNHQSMTPEDVHKVSAIINAVEE